MRPDLLWILSSCLRNTSIVLDPQSDAGQVPKLPRRQKTWLAAKILDSELPEVNLGSLVFCLAASFFKLAARNIVFFIRSKLVCQTGFLSSGSKSVFSEMSHVEVKFYVF